MVISGGLKVLREGWVAVLKRDIRKGFTERTFA